MNNCATGTIKNRALALRQLKSNAIVPNLINCRTAENSEQNLRGK